MPVSPRVAHHRGRVAGFKRAVKTGERAATDPAVAEAERALALALMEERAQKLVESWPDLTDEQIDRVATILRGGAAQ